MQGLALGAHLSQSGKLTDTMIMAAAEALPKLIPEEDKAAGCVYPRLSNIRSVVTRPALLVRCQRPITCRL